MPSVTRCQHCRHEFAISLERCPHCALPGLFPNVAMADDPRERRALERRYDRALADAATRGVEVTVREFEAATARSVAVIGRSFEETQRLAAGDSQGYGTYYEQIEAEIRFPTGEHWDSLRRVADAALFSGYEKNVRFAALSLDGRGLTSYGECSWVLREKMIAHRASVFEENSVMFMEHHDVKMSRAHKLPRGHRAVWAERGKLCTAKLGGKIDAETTNDHFSGLLLRPGKTTAEDDFVEVHVGGPMTVRTLERIVVAAPAKRRRGTIVKALREKIGKIKDLDVKVET